MKQARWIDSHREVKPSPFREEGFCNKDRRWKQYYSAVMLSGHYVCAECPYWQEMMTLRVSEADQMCAACRFAENRRRAGWGTTSEGLAAPF